MAWQTRRFMCTTEGTGTQFGRLHEKQAQFRSIMKRRQLESIADAIQNQIPLLRVRFGDEEVNQFLGAIERRNVRQQHRAPGVEPTRPVDRK